MSSRNELLFVNDQNSDIIREDFSSPISALGVDQSLKRIIVIENGIKQTKIIKLIDSHNRSSDYLPLIPGVTKVLPSLSNDGLFIANLSHVVSMDSTKTFYQGQRINDIAIDYCRNILYVVDSGSLYFVSLNGSSEIVNQPTDAQAQLVTNHAILTKNDDISHSDGFVIASTKTGKKICSSMASKSYNIRAITQSKNQLFLLDALNFAIWTVDLDQTSSICDLKSWKHMDDSDQLLDFVILNDSIVCLSHDDSKDQYLVTPTLPATTVTPQQLDSCHNYCINGACSKTTLNIPVCHCSLEFSGNRCEIETCHNFCLNNGVCNISNLGAPLCHCPDGFNGIRCQDVEIIETTPVLDFQDAFIISSSLCFVFLVISVVLVIFMLRSKLNKSSEPVLVKKTARTRVFSTSSNGRSRSASKSRNSCGGAVNSAFKDSKSDNAGSHMCQALISDDGVVLDLEDCCNMTVCEKPCVEASFRKPNYRKKNQQLLLEPDDLF